MRFLKREELMICILDILNQRVYNGLVLNASFISDYFDLYYNTKSDIKDAIIQLHKNHFLVLKNYSLILYEKQSKVKFDFRFHLHIDLN